MHTFEHSVIVVVVHGGVVMVVLSAMLHLLRDHVEQRAVVWKRFAVLCFVSLNSLRARHGTRVHAKVV